MSVKDLSTCVDPAIGTLLMEFELECLPEGERRNFEKHLLICDFCFEEAAKMQALSTTLVANRRQVSEILAATPDTSTQFVADSPIQPIRARRPESKANILDWLFGPKIAWSFATVAAIILVVWVNTSSISTPDTSAFGPIRWNLRQTVRGDAAMEQFDKAGDAYRSGDYASAESLLVSIAGPSSKPEVWLYLGASRFMLTEYETAIAALDKAGNSRGEIGVEARFYTALSYLRHDEPRKAKALLQELVAEKSSRSSDAEKLLSEM